MTQAVHTPDLPAPATMSEGAQTILAAAEELFAAKGFAGASISQIAKQAGISKATIFHHFESKEALYLAVLQNAAEKFGYVVDEMERDEGPLPERLSHFIQAHMTQVHDQGAGLRLILRELLDTDEDRGQQFAEKVSGQHFSRLVAILRDCQVRGELRQDIDLAMMATVLIGTNVFVFQTGDMLRHLAEVDFVDNPDRYSQLLTDMLLNGMLQSEQK